MINFSKNDFSQAKVGDRVFDVLNEWGEIKGVYKGYIQVWFGHLMFSAAYRFDGRIYETDYLPRLYWSEIHFDIPERPKRKVRKQFCFWGLAAEDGGTAAERFKTKDEAEKYCKCNSFVDYIYPVEIKYEIEIEE